MYHSRIRRLPMCLVLAGAAATVSDAGAGDDTREVVAGEVARRIDAHLSRLVAFGFGGAVLVERGGEVALARGYGSAFDVQGYANTGATVFSLESASKQFTAAAVMKLQMSGRLSVHDTLGDLLDDVPPDKQAISVRQLLSHTSGLVTGTTSRLRDQSRDGLLREVLAAPLLFEPGTDFAYSNYGFAVAAAIVEMASGTTFDDYLRRELLEPAGLTSTGRRFVRPSELRFAHRYLGGADRGTQLERPHPDWNQIGAGGMLSTVWDMRRWRRALVGHEVLSSEAVSAMLTPVHGAYGFGWSIEDTDHGRVIRHNGGSSEGSASQLWFNLDTGDSLVVFCNRDGERVLFGEGLVTRLIGMMYGQTPPLPPEGRPLDVAEIAVGEGTFVAGDAGSITVTARAGMLHAAFEGQAVVDAALGLDRATSTRFGGLSRDARQILDRLDDDEDVPGKLGPRFRETLRTRIRSGAESMGPFRDLVVLGTVPDWVWGGSECMTIVRMRFENDADHFRLHWSDDRVVGVGGGGVTTPAGLWLLADAGSRDRFVCFHPATGAALRLDVHRDDDGRIMAVSIGGIRAERRRSDSL